MLAWPYLRRGTEEAIARRLGARRIHRAKSVYIWLYIPGRARRRGGIAAVERPSAIRDDRRS